ncbi:hypothetical protein OROHE_010633 [Orobanche hederae]
MRISETEAVAVEEVRKSNHVQRILDKHQEQSHLGTIRWWPFVSCYLITPRPMWHADGYILEGMDEETSEKEGKGAGGA